MIHIAHTTKSLSQKEVKKNWVLVDATDLVVGRLAALLAMRLRGKHLPSYTPHIDCGDNIVVVNAAKAKLTGKKQIDKKYYRHTNYPGGIKTSTPAELFSKNRASRVIELAVKRMLPSTRLGRQQLKNLRVYESAEHPHSAQNPTALDVGALNRKNKLNA